MRGITLYSGKRWPGHGDGAFTAARHRKEEMLPEWEEGFVHWQRRKLSTSPPRVRPPNHKPAQDLRKYSFHYRSTRSDESVPPRVTVPMYWMHKRLNDRIQSAISKENSWPDVLEVRIWMNMLRCDSHRLNTRFYTKPLPASCQEELDIRACQHILCTRVYGTSGHRQKANRLGAGKRTLILYY